MSIDIAYNSATGDTVTTTADDNVTLFNRIQALSSRVSALEAIPAQPDWITVSGLVSPLSYSNINNLIRYKKTAFDFVVIEVPSIGLNPTTSTTISVFSLPEGFRPNTYIYTRGGRNSWSAYDYEYCVTPSGQVSLYCSAQNTSIQQVGNTQIIFCI